MKFNNTQVLKNFINNINSTILSSCTVDSYYKLNLDQKMNTLNLTYKIIKNSVGIRGTLDDDQMKSLLTVLVKKNEEFEHYEMAGVLKDILNNFQTVNESIKPKRKNSKIIKIENKGGQT